MKLRREIIPTIDAKLPKTRKEQLKEILKHNFSFIVDISLLLTLFTIPLYVIVVLEFSFISMLNDFSFEKVFPLIFYFGLIAIIGFILRGLAKGACYNLLRLKIFNEGYFIMSKFFESIKKNFLKYFLISLIEGIAYFISTVGIIFFLYNTTEVIAKGIGIGVCVLLFIMIYIIEDYFLNNQNFYVLGFFSNLKNAFSLSIMTFPASLLYFILSFLLPVGLCAINFWVALIVFLIVSLFYDGFILILEFFYINSRLNKFINKDNYPEIVNKGLAKED